MRFTATRSDINLLAKNEPEKTDSINTCEYKFLALIDKDDEYYQTILNNIIRNKAHILDRNELGSGIEFRLKFSSKSDMATFIREISPGSAENNWDLSYFG